MDQEEEAAVPGVSTAYVGNDVEVYRAGDENDNQLPVVREGKGALVRNDLYHVLDHFTEDEREGAGGGHGKGGSGFINNHDWVFL